MNKKSIKLNSANIITIRKNIDITINKYWRIIRAENLMSKKAIAAKQGSGLDLKSLYNQIVQLSEKRIMIKGILVALNTGQLHSLTRILRRQITIVFLQHARQRRQ